MVHASPAKLGTRFILATMNELTTDQKQALHSPALAQIEQLQSLLESRMAMFDKLGQYADYLIKADLVPESFSKKDRSTRYDDDQIRARLVLALSQGFALGLSEQECLQNTYIVGNRLTVYGNAVVRKIRENENCQGLNYEHQTKEDGSIQGVSVHLKHRVEGNVTLNYTAQDAYIAGLWPAKFDSKTQQYYKYSASGNAYQDNWCKQPKDMLLRKAIARIRNYYFPEILSGFDMESDPITWAGQEPEKIVQPVIVASSMSLEDVKEAFKKLKEAQDKEGLKALYENAPESIKNLISSYLSEHKFIDADDAEDNADDFVVVHHQGSKPEPVEMEASNGLHIPSAEQRELSEVEKKMLKKYNSKNQIMSFAKAKGIPEDHRDIVAALAALES